MKQIRKLHVRTGQELSAFAQDQVMAGGNSIGRVCAVVQKLAIPTMKVGL